MKWRNPTNVWNVNLVSSKKKSWTHTLHSTVVFRFKHVRFKEAFDLRKISLFSKWKSMLNSPKRKVEHTYHFSAWNVKTNSILNIQKIAIKASQVIFSKYGLSLDVLTKIFERWGRIINLTLPNCSITYWTLKKCFIKANQVVSSKYGLSLMFWQISLRDEAE